MYQVTGHGAHATVDTVHGRIRTFLLHGALVPPDAPEVMHLLSVGLIAPFVPPAAMSASTSQPAVDSQPEADPALDSARAAARAKLPEDGSVPDGRAAQAVWVEFLVARGYSYVALAREDKRDLMEMARKL